MRWAALASMIRLAGCVSIKEYDKAVEAARMSGQVKGLSRCADSFGSMTPAMAKYLDAQIDSLKCEAKLIECEISK